MRLHEIDQWHPGMLQALDEAHRDRWGWTEELLRLVAEEVRFVSRQLVVSAGGEDPGPLDLARPGDPRPERKPAWKQAFSQLAKGGE